MLRSTCNDIVAERAGELSVASAHAAPTNLMRPSFVPICNQWTLSKLGPVLIFAALRSIVNPVYKARLGLRGGANEGAAVAA